MKTLAEYGLTIVAVYLGIRKETGWYEPPWEHNAYDVTLRLGCEAMHLTYRKGLGLTRVVRAGPFSPPPNGVEKFNAFGPGKDGWLVPAEPTLVEVVESLVLESAAYTGARNFEDWCGEFGYDTDSRKAERIYNECAEQAKSFRRVVGRELYDALVKMDGDAREAYFREGIGGA